MGWHCVTPLFSADNAGEFKIRPGESNSGGVVNGNTSWTERVKKTNVRAWTAPKD